MGRNDAISQGTYLAKVDDNASYQTKLFRMDSKNNMVESKPFHNDNEEK
jgi:hypothetical protein